jgi:hypothetical protein
MNMDTTSEKTITQFGKHSNRGVFLSTLGFVLVGGVITVLWQDRGMFIWLVCLSCTTLPVIHYLCRELLRLRQRIQDLEQHRS